MPPSERGTLPRDVTPDTKLAEVGATPQRPTIVEYVRIRSGGASQRRTSADMATPLPELPDAAVMYWRIGVAATAKPRLAMLAIFSVDTILFLAPSYTCRRDRARHELSASALELEEAASKA